MISAHKNPNRKTVKLVRLTIIEVYIFKYGVHLSYY